MKILFYLLLLIPVLAFGQTDSTATSLDNKNGFRDFTFDKKESDFKNLSNDTKKDGIRYRRVLHMQPQTMLRFMSDGHLGRVQVQYVNDVYTEIIKAFGEPSEKIVGDLQTYYYWYGKKMTVVYERLVVPDLGSSLVYKLPLDKLNYHLYYYDIPGSEYRKKREREIAKEF